MTLKSMRTVCENPKCDGATCQECCEHGDMDGYQCLDCGMDRTEDMMSAAYDRAKDARKYGDT